LELLTELLVNPIEQIVGGGLNFLKMSWQFFIFVWDEVDVLPPRHAEPRTSIRSQ
jgi:hypothetical protein